MLWCVNDIYKSTTGLMFCTAQDDSDVDRVGGLGNGRGQEKVGTRRQPAATPDKSWHNVLL